MRSFDERFSDSLVRGTVLYEYGLKNTLDIDIWYNIKIRHNIETRLWESLVSCLTDVIIDNIRDVHDA